MRYTERMTKPDRTTVDIKGLRERITAVSALPELADRALSSVLRILVTKGLESYEEKLAQSTQQQISPRTEESSND
ncbi:MAG: hypothetical protein WBA89_19640 [Microcoleus sp.]|uniref:hypothetical protein n=1 Tax=Microcoleus sp. TaxID=44472 RepID=UPI003C7174FC